MLILKTVAALRRFRARARGKVVLVPTMGALHAGHADLIARARKLAGKSGTVIVSIFVNPTQFGPKEDLSRYPRPVENDERMAAEAGVDLLFRPAVEEMYHDDRSVTVTAGALGADWEGKSRPGHFDGVLTVVLKLFNLVQPTRAYFGE